MKTYSIGREPSCSIVINDPQKIISRNHAILTIADNGKITIVDQSTNGTYINGIRISSNVPVPVTRKDRISFARVANLDWDRIPKEGGNLKYVWWTLGGVVVAGLIVWLIITLIGKSGNCNREPIPGDLITMPTDSTETDGQKDKERQKQISDSLKHLTDSLQQALDKKAKVKKPKEDNGGKNGGNNEGKNKPKQPKTEEPEVVPDL